MHLGSSKRVNMLMEYDNRLEEWLKTHSRLPRVIMNFINVDVDPPKSSLYDFIALKLNKKEDPLDKTKQIRSKTNKEVLERKTCVKTHNHFQTLTTSLVDGGVNKECEVKVQTETKTEVKTLVSEVVGEWFQNGVRSTAFCDGLISEITCVENNNLFFSIELMDLIKTFKMSAKVQTFFSVFGNVKLKMKEFHIYDYVRKNIWELLENDRLLDLVNMGVIELDQVICDELIIDYEARINKLQDLLFRERELSRRWARQLKITTSLKTSFERRNAELQSLLSSDDSDRKTVDIKTFLYSVALAMKDKWKGNFGSNDHINRAIDDYNRIVRTGWSTKDIDRNMINMLEDADLHLSRITAAEFEARNEVDVVNLDEESDPDDEYLDDDDY